MITPDFSGNIVADAHIGNNPESQFVLKIIVIKCHSPLLQVWSEIKLLLLQQQNSSCPQEWQTLPICIGGQWKRRMKKEHKG